MDFPGRYPNDGMDEIIDKIYAFLELEANLKIFSQVKTRLLYHSKNPELIYANDTNIHNPLITSETRNAYLKIEGLTKKHN